MYCGTAVVSAISFTAWFNWQPQMRFGTMVIAGHRHCDGNNSFNIPLFGPNTDEGGSSAREWQTSSPISRLGIYSGRQSLERQLVAPLRPILNGEFRPNSGLSGYGKDAPLADMLPFLQSNRVTRVYRGACFGCTDQASGSSS